MLQQGRVQPAPARGRPQSGNRGLRPNAGVKRPGGLPFFVIIGPDIAIIN